MCALHQTNICSWIFIASSLEKTTDKHVIPLQTHYPDSKSSSPCSYSIMLCKATNTNSIVFDPQSTTLQMRTLFITTPRQFLYHLENKYNISRTSLSYLTISAPITTNTAIESHEMYLIQHYVIKFVSDFWQVGGFLCQSY